MSILVQNLCKCYGKTPVWQNLNLSVTGPTVLMGPSGCGKTTLLRIMMGLEQADAGSVAGVGRVAAVFQEDRLCPQLSAPANIAVAGNVPLAQAQQQLRAFGFEDAELQLPAGKLSGGQKRRTALLRALLCADAQTLLLDEPFTGMDAALLGRAVEIIKQLAGQRDTLLVTHDAAAAALLGWPVIDMLAETSAQGK